jgi:hypothetical protein
MPTGLIVNPLRFLKSIFVRAVNAPGRIAFMKRLSESAAMMILSTTKKGNQSRDYSILKMFITTVIAPRFTDKVQETIHSLDILNQVHRVAVVCIWGRFVYANEDFRRGQ